MRLFFWVAGISLAALGAWASRNYSTFDTVPYADMARSVATGHWSGLVNGLWSPGYPFLIGLVLRLLDPSAYWLYGSIHFLNFLIFVAALGAFDFLWRELGRRRDGDTLPEWAWNLLGYSLFLWAALNAIGVWLITPDLLFCAFLLLSIGLLLRARRTGSGAWFAALGAALGFGYLAKAPMFPIALLILVVAPVRPRATGRLPAKLALAGAIFVAIVVPWVAALHARYDRWTFGQSAALNYAWHVTGVPHFIHWQGGPAGSGAPIHTTPMIFDHPEAFADAGPMAGTFPPGDDETYWYEGVRTHFNLSRQLQVLRASLEAYAKMFFRPLAALSAGFLVLAFLAARENALRLVFTTAWPVWVVGAAGLAMFGLVSVDFRYVAGFLLLFWAGLFAGLRVRRSRWAALTVTLAAALSLGALVARAAVRDFRGRFPGSNHPQWQVVEGLKEFGLGPGDRVALLGQEIFWAPMSGMEIVADIPEDQVPYFWQLDGTRREVLLERLAATGARAIVAGPEALAGEATAPPEDKKGWIPLGKTGYQILQLRN